MKFTFVILNVISFITLAKCADLLLTCSNVDIMNKIFEFDENPFRVYIFVSKNWRNVIYYKLRNIAARLLDMPQLLELTGSEEERSDLLELMALLKIEKRQWRTFPIFIEIFKNRNLQAVIPQVMEYVKPSFPRESMIVQPDFFKLYGWNKKYLHSYILSNREAVNILLDLFHYDYIAFSLLTDSWCHPALVSLMMELIKSDETIQDKLKLLFLPERIATLRVEDEEIMIAQMLAHLILFDVSESIWGEGFEAFSFPLKTAVFIGCLSSIFPSRLEERREFLEAVMNDLLLQFDANNAVDSVAADLLKTAKKIIFDRNVSTFEICRELLDSIEKYSNEQIHRLSFLAIKSKRFSIFEIADFQKTFDNVLGYLLKSNDCDTNASMFFNALKFLSLDATKEVLSRLYSESFDLIFKYYELKDARFTEKYVNVFVVRLPGFEDCEFPKAFNFCICRDNKFATKYFLSVVKFSDISQAQFLLAEILKSDFNDVSDNELILSQWILKSAVENKSFRAFLVQLAVHSNILFECTEGNVDVSILPIELSKFDTERIQLVVEKFESDADVRTFLVSHALTCENVYSRILINRDPESLIELFFRYKSFFLYWLRSDEWRSFENIAEIYLKKLASAYFPEKMRLLSK